jgi:hypothetical protein
MAPRAAIDDERAVQAFGDVAVDGHATSKRNRQPLDSWSTTLDVVAPEGRTGRAASRSRPAEAGWGHLIAGYSRPASVTLCRNCWVRGC